MTDLLKLILGVLASLFKSRAELEAEILVLRQQINVLRRRMPKRPHLNNTDRFLFVWLYRWFPSVLAAFAVVRPETMIRWHRAGFRAYWRWRSRNRVGRPKISGSAPRSAVASQTIISTAHTQRDYLYEVAHVMDSSSKHAVHVT
jgi:hypothetical protein